VATAHAQDALSVIGEAIAACERCPRLRGYCREIATTKRAAFRGETYWGRPVPGFGDPAAAIVIVGLAPAAHGANRTGRMFTGDGTGGSGDFLMTALYANGLASQPFSRSKNDGLQLTNAWLTAAVRCAPPGNRPAPDEIRRCHDHLIAETGALAGSRVFVALGRLAFDACLRLLDADGRRMRRMPAFGHGRDYLLDRGRTLIASYHPSRQNTHTGRLTPEMLREVFRLAVTVAATSSSDDRRVSTARRTLRPIP
jgi:uracil-DNA glycosylase family 4